jgi:hypothetical protein
MKKYSTIISLSFLLSLTALAADAKPLCENGAVLNPETQSTAQAIAPQCFDERPKKIEFMTLPENETYRIDQEVCACLQKNPFTKSLMDSAPIVINPEQSQSYVEPLNKVVDHVNDHFEVVRNGLMFQAMNLNGSEQDIEFMKLYSMRYLGDSSAVAIKETNTKLSSSVPEGAKTNLVKVPDDIDQNYFLDHSSCFEIRDFIAYNQVPKSDGAYEAFAKAKKFVAAEWDPEEFSNSEEDMFLLDAKKKFIKDNPLYGTLLSIKEPNPEVKVQQEKLFNALKSNFEETFKLCAPPSPPGTCHRMHLRLGNHLKNKAEIKSIFQNDKVVAAINAATEAKITKGLKEELEPFMTKRRPSMIALAESVSVDKCDSTVSTAGVQAQVYTACVSSFKSHCQNLTEIEALPPYEELFSTELTDVEDTNLNVIDPKKNPNLKKLRASLCGMRSDGKSPEKTIDFKDFKNKICSEGSKDTICQPSSRRILLARFLREFPKSPELDPDNDVLSSDMDKSLETLISFLDQNVEADIDAKGLKSIAESGKTKEEFSRNLTEYAKTYVANSSTRIAQATAQSTPVNQKSSPIERPLTRDNLDSIPALPPVAQPPFPTFSPAATQKDLHSFSTLSRASAPEARRETDPLVKPKAKAETALSEDKAVDTRSSESYKRLENRISQLREKLKESNAKEDFKAKPTTNELRAPAAQPPTLAPSFQQATASNGQRSNPLPPSQQVSNADTGSQRSSPMSFASSGISSRGNASKSIYNVKYDLDKESVSGKLIVAQELALSKIDPQVLNEAGRNETVPVSVSKEDFEKIVNRDLETLANLAKRLKTALGDVIKVNVTSQAYGVEPLQLLFLKKEGQMLYQPIRTYTFKKLQEITNQ